MLRKLRPVLAGFAVLISASAAMTAPASANADITATSVALATDGANCTDADLAIGLTAVDVAREYGLVTNAAGDTLGEFESDNDTGWDGFDDVYDGYGMPVEPNQLEGTIIGSYAYVGQTPPSATDTAEWFVLYRCSDSPGGNVVLYSCFGDYGTCPQTAADAIEQIFAGSVDDTTPDPGQTITASAEGCGYPLGGALLLRAGTSLGGDSTEVNPDGSYEIELTVPADVPPGTALRVRFDCGFDGDTVLSTTVDLVVAGQATTSSTTSTTTAAAPRATPRFTG